MPNVCSEETERRENTSISIWVTKGRAGWKRDARQMDLIKSSSAQMLISIIRDCETDESPEGSIIRAQSQFLCSL